MAFLIGGANSDSGAYQIDNSLRWNSGDSPSLQQTYTNTGTGAARTLTVSTWIKKSAGDAYLISAQSDSNNRTVMAVFSTVAGGGVAFENKISGTSSYTTSLATFRDPSAWYHVVWAVDTTQGTDSNRVKIYINGEQLTDLKTGSGYAYPAEDTVTNFFHNSNATFIGGRSGGNYYNGYMAELNIVDGLQLAASNFGETNDNGVWVPKKPDVSEYGTNGGFYEFKQTGTGADASGMGADTSGKTNHFTVANLTATDVTTDTCTNNFATLNPLANRSIVDSGSKSFGATTYSEGNLKAVATASNTAGNSVATFGSSMPFYFEVKITSSANHNNDDMRIGVVDIDHASGNAQQWVSYYSFDGVLVATGESNNTGNTSSGDGHIIGVACDFTTNNTVTFYHNGTSQGAMAVGATYRSLIPVPWIRQVNTNTWEANFGNSPFSISSGNADENGYGNFEYAVPSGYYALCTKNLAEYG